jgi:hypothetical protein
MTFPDTEIQDLNWRLRVTPYDLSVITRRLAPSVYRIAFGKRLKKGVGICSKGGLPGTHDERTFA